MPHPTIAASYPAALLRYAAAQGVDRRLLAQRGGVLEAALDDPDARVPLTQYIRLLEAGIEASGDPAFALHFGERVPMREISLVGLVSEYAASAEEGCELHNRYGRLALDAGEAQPAAGMQLLRERGEVWVVFANPLYIEHPLLTESSFARCICGIRGMYAAAGRSSRWPYPREIHFTHAEPPHRSAYDRLFGVPLVFGSTRNAWRMDEAFLATRRNIPNTYVAHALHKHAESLLARLDVSRTTRGQVEQVLTARLRTGATAESVAAELGLSRQTMLRRLKAEGVTFQLVLAQLREKLAVRFLNQRRHSVKRIAHELGFSDATAFSRAFKRWAGRSPREFASDHAGGEPRAGSSRARPDRGARLSRSTRG